MSSPSSQADNQHLRGVVWLGVTAALASLFAFGLGPLVRSVPWSAEEALANRLGSMSESMECHRTTSVAALERLVARLYPLGDGDHDFPITVQVLRGDEVNAFASLGGRIYVNDALIRKAESPDELAGVLAHEIGHVAKRHVLRGIALQLLTIPFFAWSDSGGLISARTLEMLAHLKFGRQQEHEADLDGLERLQKAKIDPAAVARFFERLGESSSVPEIISDHPASDRRAELAKSYGGGVTEPALSTEDWKELQRICRD